MLFEFKDMLEDYESPIQVVITTSDTTTNAGYDEETGESIKGTIENTEPIDTSGVVLPYSANEIYQSGGRLTQYSRQLIIDMQIPPKSLVIHEGQKYSVENKSGYEDFADFIQYELKWVSAFG
ncbi:hypothetical protein ACQKIC_16435 [Peribacillus sp. NPDC046944]